MKLLQLSKWKKVLVICFLVSLVAASGAVAFVVEGKRMNAPPVAAASDLPDMQELWAEAYEANTHAQLRELIQQTPLNGARIIALTADITGGNIPIDRRQITLISGPELVETPATFHSVTSPANNRHFTVTGATGSLILANVTLDGGWVTGAVQRGGVVVLAGATLELHAHAVIRRAFWNTTTGTNAGAGIHATGTASTVRMFDGSEVRENRHSGTGQAAGGIHLLLGSRLFMHGGDIYRNSTAGNAAGIFAGHATAIHSGVEVQLLGGRVYRNTATGFSGGMHVNFGATGIVNGTDFLYNTTSGNAGGIGVYASAHVVMYSGRIAGNRAANGSGVAIGLGSTTAQGHRFVMHGGYIEDNVTAGNGGGVVIGGVAGLNFTMHGGVIRNNEATNGGGVWVASNTTATINGGEISNNHARTDGGAVFTGAANYANLTTGATTLFFGNTAGAGAFYPPHPRPAQIQSAGYSVEAAGHVLNNYDINSRGERLITVRFYLPDEEPVLAYVARNGILPAAQIPDTDGMYEHGFQLWGWFTEDMLTRKDATRPLAGSNGVNLAAPLTIVAEGVHEITLFSIWRLWGDINGDDLVDRDDFELLRSYIARRPGVELPHPKAAYVTRGDHIGIQDFGRLQRYLAGVPGSELGTP